MTDDNQFFFIKGLGIKSLPTQNHLTISAVTLFSAEQKMIGICFSLRDPPFDNNFQSENSSNHSHDTASSSNIRSKFGLSLLGQY